mgnify:CR=1 FL=1
MSQQQSRFPALFTCYFFVYIRQCINTGNANKEQKDATATFLGEPGLVIV